MWLFFPPLFNHHQQVWKVCEEGDIVTHRTSRRPSLLVKRLRYTERGKFAPIPAWTGMSSEARNLSLSLGSRLKTPCSSSNSRGPWNEELYIVICWRLFWWTDCNGFVGQGFVPFLMDCTEEEWVSHLSQDILYCVVASYCSRCGSV